MKRTEKENVVAKLHEKFSGASVSVLADYTGMNVEEIREAKTAFRKAKGEFKVVKNRLAARAAIGTPLEKVSGYFKGPVVLAISSVDPVSPIKALKEILDGQKKLKMKVGVIENRVVDLPALREVAKLPRKEEMLGQLVVRMKSPLYGIAFSLSGVLSKFVGTLQAVKTAREKTG